MDAKVLRAALVDVQRERGRVVAERDALRAEVERVTAELAEARLHVMPDVDGYFSEAEGGPICCGTFDPDCKPSSGPMVALSVYKRALDELDALRERVAAATAEGERNARMTWRDFPFGETAYADGRSAAAEAILAALTLPTGAEPEPKRCRKCRRPLQEVRYERGTMLRCECGYACTVECAEQDRRLEPKRETVTQTTCQECNGTKQLGCLRCPQTYMGITGTCTKHPEDPCPPCPACGGKGVKP